MVVQDIHQEETDINMPYPSSIKAFINPISRTNLVAWYDAGNPSSYPGSGTTIYDLTGSGKIGNLVNGPTYSTAGGGSILCDGANDVISWPSSTDYDFAGDFTIELWSFYIPFLGSSFDGGGGWQGMGLIHRRDLVSGSGAATWALATAGTDYWWQQLFPPYTAIFSGGYHSRNRWMHICASRSSGVVKFYVNGSLVFTANDAFNYTSTYAMQFGHWDNIAYAKERFAILRIYQRSLTQSEIIKHYNSEKNRFINEVSNIAEQLETKTTHYSGVPTRFSAAKYPTDVTEGTTRRNLTLTLTDFKGQIDDTSNNSNSPKLSQNLGISNDKKAYISNLSQESMNSVMNQLENVTKISQKLYQDILLLKSQSINKNGVYPSSKYR